MSHMFQEILKIFDLNLVFAIPYIGSIFLPEDSSSPVIRKKSVF